jgi:hypothetical protein
MGRELGRISGPLLADNLRRNGANLAFDNQVLYLDVVNGRVGFNSNSPVNEVYAPNAIDTVNLIVDTQSNLANFTITTNTIQDAISSITISPNQSSTPTIVTPAVSTSNLLFRNNLISNTVSNDPINITATGTGVINLNSDTTVTGNLHATGNITWDGNITLGNNLAQDTVTFGADVGSSILPSVTNLYDLGNNTTPLRWGTTYVNTTTATGINTTNLSTTTFIGSGTNGLNGNVIIGTTNGNTLTVTARINSSLIPATTNTYNLGSSTGPLYWNNVYAITFNNGNITLTNNTIQTTTTNSNLRLIANGSGQVVFSKLNVTNNVTVGGTLGVTGTSTLTNTATGAITQTGDYNLTGDTGITGNLSTVNITQIDNGSVYLRLPSVTITGSNINVTASNTDLQFLATGSGRVLIPSNSLQVTNNATVGGTLTVSNTSTLTNTSTGAITQTGDFNQTGNTIISGTLTSGDITTVAPFTLPGITINTNSIQSTTSNTDLQFTANGSGKIIFSNLSLPNTNNISVGGTLGVTGTTTLNNNVTSGAIIQTGSYNITGTATLGTVSSGNITAANPLILPTITIDNSTITGTASGNNLTLTANTGQKVEVTSTAKFNNNVSVGGTLGVTGATTLSNNVTSGAITQTGSYNITGTATLGTVSSGNITAANPFTLVSITLNGSVITGTANNNLTLTPKAGQQLEITSNATVDQNLTVGNPNGTLSVSGTTTFSNNVTSGAIIQTGSYNITGTATLGTVSSGSITAADPLLLPTVTINGSIITGTASGSNLILTANTGQHLEITSNAKFDNNLNINGTLGVAGTTTLTNTSSGIIIQTGDFNQTGNTSVTGTYTVGGNITVTGVGSYLNIGNFNIANQTITSTVTNDTITFLANGVGYTWLGNDLKISNNALINNWINQSVPYVSENNQIFISENGQTLYTEFGTATALQDSILFTPTGTGNVIINSNKSIVLPVSNDINGTLINNGAIRFNNINLNIEGYSNTGYVNFFNLYSQDYNTYVTPELTPNAGDNLIRFGIASNITTTISSTTLYNDTMYAGNVRISGNTINNTSATTDLTISTSGTGRVKFNGINYVNGNTFYVPSNAGVNFANTGQGHMKFGGTAGLVIPYGTSSNYPVSPQTGTLRFNTFQDILEIYDGSSWTAAYGVSSSLTQAEISSLVEVYTLLLGF